MLISAVSWRSIKTERCRNAKHNGETQMEMSPETLRQLAGRQLGILSSNQERLCGEIVSAQLHNTWLIINLAWCAKYDPANDTWNFDPDFKQHALDMVVFDPKHCASDVGSTYTSEVVGESCTFFPSGFTLVDPKKIRIPN